MLYRQQGCCYEADLNDKYLCPNKAINSGHTCWWIHTHTHRNGGIINQVWNACCVWLTCLSVHSMSYPSDVNSPIVWQVWRMTGCFFYVPLYNHMCEICRLRSIYKTSMLKCNFLVMYSCCRISFCTSWHRRFAHTDSTCTTKRSGVLPIIKPSFLSPERWTRRCSKHARGWQHWWKGKQLPINNINAFTGPCKKWWWNTFEPWMPSKGSDRYTAYG